MNQAVPNLVGMIHLLPLPGSPGFSGSVDEILETAAADARVLADAGFPALMVENFGDVPFYADNVPPETIAGITAAVGQVMRSELPTGVNVLRNDGLAAIGIAASTNASMIRVNVLTGLMITDQGPISGRAAEIQRKRAAVSPDVEVWADVMVKHASPPAGFDVSQSARDMVDRGLADAVIVSGSGTGSAPDLEVAKIVREAVPGTRLVIGSGASPDNLESLTEVADSVIVGSAIKVEGDAKNRPDPGHAELFVKTAVKLGLI